MEPAWRLDEISHAGSEHLDPAFVAGFDDKQGRPDPARDLGALAARGLGEGSTVVDLGAGTGQFALPAARRFGRVVAVDVSPAMAGALRRRAEAEGLGNLAVVEAGFLSYEHRGTPADAVHTRNALHQLPDFWKVLALARIAGMLEPGGTLLVHDLVYDCRPAEVEELFAAWFARAATDPAAGYTAADFAEHISNEHSTFSWLFEAMLEAAGFDIEERHFEASVYASYTCTRRSV